jgi:hypothetical protein
MNFTLEKTKSNWADVSGAVTLRISGTNWALEKFDTDNRCNLDRKEQSKCSYTVLAVQ